MNWVPGNLHLIGKDNQNNPPSFQIKSRLPHAPPPTLSLQACRDTGGGRLTNAVLAMRLSCYRKTVAAKQSCFCTLSLYQLFIYVTLSAKTIWSGDTCFSFSPPVSPQRPWTWRSPDCSRRGGHSLPNADICPPCTRRSHQTVHI